MHRQITMSAVCLLVFSVVGSSSAFGTALPASAVVAGETVNFDDRAYHPLSPTRILDTRTSAPVGQSASTDLQVAGAGGVPASGVGAVAVNLTGTQPTAATFVTVYPTGEARPNASNLNLLPGQTTPNMVIIKLGAGGRVTLYNNLGSTHLIVDVMGWFEVGGDYVPLSPFRLRDTRNGTGPVGAGQAITVPVAGNAGVPPEGADAVVFNLTGTQPTGNTFVTAYPSGESMPTASNLNLALGETAPNLVIAKLGTDGAVKLYNNVGSTHLIVDVLGYLVVGGDYAGLTPARLLDTRATGPVGQSGSVALTVTGVGGVPDKGVGAVVINVTGTQPTSATFVSVYPSGEPRPNASNLNLIQGQTRPNLVVAKVGGDGKIVLYNNLGSTHLIVDVLGWISVGIQAEVTTASTTDIVEPARIAGVSGTALTVTGAAVPVGHIVAVEPSIQVPDGLLGRVTSTQSGGNGTTILHTAPVRMEEAFLEGTITGSVDTRALAATAPSSLAKALAGPALRADREGRIPIKQAQVSKCSVDVIDVDVDITVEARIVFDIDWNAAGLNRLSLEFAFDVTGSITMTAGASLSCEFNAGPKIPLPPMSLLKSSAQPKIKVELLGGVPMAAQVGGGFTVGARYVKGNPIQWVNDAGVNGSFTPPTSVGDGKARVAFGLETDVKLMGVAGPTFYGALFLEVQINPWTPGPWWHLDGGATGEIGFDIDLWFANISYQLAAHDFIRISISHAPGPWPGPRLSNVDIADGYVNEPYDLTVGISGGAPPLSLVKAYGSLPPGLALVGNHIVGTPTAAGEWTFTLGLTDAQGLSDNRTGTIQIYPPPPLTVTTSSLRHAIVDQPYSATLRAIGGNPPYSFQVTGLPSTMSADSVGTITGTPTAHGRFPLTVTVTDEDGGQTSRQIDLVVGWTIPNAELISISTTGDPGNGDSFRAMSSSNGRYVYFTSDATDLVDTSVSQPFSVYLRDRVARTTVRVTASESSNLLLATSFNGRFALLQGTEQSTYRRFDRTTGAIVTIPFNYGGTHSNFAISDDGDLVHIVGAVLHRISDQSLITFRCPNGSNLSRVPSRVRFAGDASVVYFVTADCGRSQQSLFRFVRATGTVTLIHGGNCTFNGGDACVDDVTATLGDSHYAITKLVPSTNYTVLLDATPATGVDQARYLCGVREDGQKVAFVGLSSMLPGGSDQQLDVYSYQAGAASAVRIGPPSDGNAGLYTSCTNRGLASTTGELALTSAGQVYVL